MAGPWAEKHRPRTVEATILPPRLKNVVRGIKSKMESGDFPSYIFSGPQGVGKTTAVRALLDEAQADYIFIPASIKGNIDTLRNEVMGYATAQSIYDGRKYVLLDEGDYLNQQSTQPALRNLIDEVAATCGFFITCNYPGRIIKELHSRCAFIDFTIKNEEKMALCAQFFQSVEAILQKEDVKYDKKAVANFVTRFSPDWRRVINELQNAAVNGPITLETLSNKDVAIESVMKMLKVKAFNDARKWAYDNSDCDPNLIFRKIYDEGAQYITPKSHPQMVTILADYQYKAALVADQEINLMSCLTEIMMECDFA